MNAMMIVKDCKRAGLKLSINGDKLRVNGDLNLIERLKPTLLKFKPEIMAYLKQEAANDAGNDQPMTFDSLAQESWYYAGYNTPDMRTAFMQKPPSFQETARRHYMTHVNEIIDHIRTLSALIRCTQEERQHMIDSASVVDAGRVDGLLWMYRDMIKQFHEVPAVRKRW